MAKCSKAAMWRLKTALRWKYQLRSAGQKPSSVRFLPSCPGSHVKRRPVLQCTTNYANDAAHQLIKAGALLADTKTLLAHWNTSVPVQVNLIILEE